HGEANFLQATQLLRNLTPQLLTSFVVQEETGEICFHRVDGFLHDDLQELLQVHLTGDGLGNFQQGIEIADLPFNINRWHWLRHRVSSMKPSVKVFGSLQSCSLTPQNSPLYVAYPWQEEKGDNITMAGSTSFLGSVRRFFHDYVRGMETR